MTKPTAWKLARAASAAALLGILFWRLDLSPLRERLHAFEPAWYLAGLAGILVYVVVQALLLQGLLAARGPRASVADLARMIFVSSFFGLFLPGGIGADAVLCYMLFRSTTAKESVLSAVLFARIVTLMGMVALAFAAGLHPRCPLPGLKAVALALLAAAVVGAAAFVFTWRRWGARQLARLADGTSLPRRAARFGLRTLDVLSDLSGDPRALGRVVPLVLIVSLMRIGMDYVSARSLGLAIAPINFFLFTPVATIATTIPLTTAGLGVREGSYVYLFSLVGVKGADAMCVSLVSFSFTLWVSLIGAFIYAASSARLALAQAPRQ